MAQFEKGQSGNPGGRPKRNRDVQELAKEYTHEAIIRLVQLMRQKSDTNTARQAAMALLERGWGKARDGLELTGKDGGPIKTEAVSDTEAARLIAFALAQGVKNQEGNEVQPEDLSPSTDTEQ